MFVPTWPGMDATILAHSSDAAAVPELATESSALEFIARQQTHDGISAVPSELPMGAILPIPLVTSLWQEPPGSLAAANRSFHPARRAADRQNGSHIAGWLALRFADDRTNALVATTGSSSHERPGLLLGQAALGLAARLASLYLFLYDSLADPLTGLPGRSVLRTLLRRELGVARSERSPLSILLFNADDFAHVNATHGRETGDHVLREIVARAQATLRYTDLLCRHGAATFAVILGNSGREAAAIVADKLQRALGTKPYLDDAIALTFSMGTASAGVDEERAPDPIDFIGHAESALAMARKSGGARVCTWRDGITEETEPLDRLRHAFTGDQDRDYRNMGLLWDTVSLLAATNSPLELAKRVSHQLRRAVSASLVGFFEPGVSGLELRYAVSQELGGADETEADLPAFSAPHRDLAARAATTKTPMWSGPSQTEPGQSVCCAVPLSVDGQLLGVLVLSGTNGYITVDGTDLRFMTGLAGPIALALQRALAAERQQQQDRLEKRRLVDELKNLRQSLRQTKVVHASPKMEDLLVTAHRVADTDATVLILGESGTGKEMLAQTIHHMSNRRNRPLVIVDCGAIPSTLIESELFGHERGAFTGALQKSLGRLAQADGGTVLLDEIGELPLEVQSKLLRFVQEKHFTSVGSSVLRRVDVRVLAATNRDLASEVVAGRFRGDLFHRLNVIPLSIPPLRERAEDVLELARHFLEVFAPKYQKAVRAFGPGVEDALLRYEWPGNVRELQNRMMRAVIMSSGETLTLDMLGLPAASRSASSRILPAYAPPASLSGMVAAHPGDVFGVPEPAGAAPSSRNAFNGASVVEADQRVRDDSATPAVTKSSDPWTTLGEALRTIVGSHTTSTTSVYPPLGRWLDNDLVLAASAASSHVARRAASRLGLPETTFVRRLKRAQNEELMTRRTGDWEPVRQVVNRLVQAAEHSDRDVLAAAEMCLLEAILRHVPHDQTAGAALLGTSLPTFRRRVMQLNTV